MYRQSYPERSNFLWPLTAIPQKLVENLIWKLIWYIVVSMNENVSILAKNQTETH